jgi:hypothetical protein
VPKANIETPSEGKALDTSKGTPIKDEVLKRAREAQIRKRYHPTTVVAPPRGRWMEGGATFAKTKVTKRASQETTLE